MEQIVLAKLMLPGLAFHGRRSDRRVGDVDDHLPGNLRDFHAARAHGRSLARVYVRRDEHRNHVWACMRQGFRFQRKSYGHRHDRRVCGVNVRREDSQCGHRAAQPCGRNSCRGRAYVLRVSCRE